MSRMDHWTYIETQGKFALQTSNWFPTNSSAVKAKIEAELDKGTGQLAFFTMWNTTMERASGCDIELPHEAALELTTWLANGLFNGEFPAHS